MKRFAGLLATILLLATGCNGSHGGYGYTSTYYPTGTGTTVTTTTPAPALVVQVSNSSPCPIHVFAVSPEQNYDVGTILPGGTISFDLGDLPADVELQATAESADAAGFVPTFEPITLVDGSAYSDASPFAGVDWVPDNSPPATPNAQFDVLRTSEHFVARPAVRDPNAHLLIPARSSGKI
jgi:hypothetical protein